jgi:ABC-type lipoprotein release transport system permease subunit
MFGVLGWTLGVLAGYPLGLVLTRTFETVLFHIDYMFSAQMVGLSLAFALVLAGGASLIPALAAARMRVSEALRYE